jgi:alkanesulfonate monooxygenase SsuD/methylene tetrahydromethanopterin reductase-like flavin-dependent oxidoreductase (luciferase family)
MKFGISLPPFGDYAEPRYLAEIAREAEAVGWDGFFIWDHVMFDPTFHPIIDPWVGLAAIALNTQKIRIGTMVTPVPRRRPWQLARETVSLDRLSGGRVVFGVGLGEPPQWDYGFFGEEQDAKIRAQKLDEGLAILDGLWSGEFFGYEGTHYKLEKMRFLPRAIQSPRIPVWVGGTWNKHAPMRRAAKWDGYFPLKWQEILTPEEWKVIMDYVNQHRTNPGAPFDWVHGGTIDDPAKSADIVKPYEEIGVTWWVEGIDPWRYGWKWEDQLTPGIIATMNARIRLGPPKI